MKNYIFLFLFGTSLAAEIGHNGRPTGRWPNNLEKGVNEEKNYQAIPYRFAPGQISTEYQTVITKTLDRISSTLLNGCIKWIDDTETQKFTHWIEVTSTEPGCFANVGFRGNKNYLDNSGKIVNAKQQVNLESLEKCGPSTITHEFLHAMGFIHEHQRPDRNQYVNVHYENIDVPEGLPEDRQTFIDTNFKEYEITAWYDAGTAYDVESIMHYSSGEGEKGSHITKKNGFSKIYRTSHLSETDVWLLAQMYPKYCMAVLETMPTLSNKPIYGASTSSGLLLMLTKFMGLGILCILSLTFLEDEKFKSGRELDSKKTLEEAWERSRRNRLLQLQAEHDKIAFIKQQNEIQNEKLRRRTEFKLMNIPKPRTCILGS